MRAVQKPWVKLKETLDREDYQAIRAMEVECAQRDAVALKLELDYKLGAAAGGTRAAMGAVNELMYYDGDKLIGYIGIGDFGGAGNPPELNGMVHPDYRRLGVFQTLSRLAIWECGRRNCKSILLLCDRQSAAGQSFVKKTGARFHHSEFEMYLRREKQADGKDYPVLDFRKAVNADAAEIARQNAILFGEELGAAEGDKDVSGLMMPEEEEKKGMTVYFGVYQGLVIGKVHLQLAAGVGGIYGLGVLPEYRGKGFGRALLMGGVKKLMDAGAKEIMLQVVTENANALCLYESCGFEVTSTMDYFELDILPSRPAISRESVSIRSGLRPGDVGKLIHLHGWIYNRECGYDHGFEGYVCKTFCEFLELYSPDKDRIWFAEAEGEMIGAIAIAGHTERKAQLRWFILHPDYRGLGLGSRLMGEAMAYCREKGYKDIFLYTTRDQQAAIRMYEKAGFQKVSENESDMWGKHLTELTYELHIP